MATSENLRFFYELQPSQAVEHPPGASIANLLRNGLMERGWNVADLDNWRDCGWVFVCKKKHAELQLVLAQMANGSHWLLQVSPKYLPGIVGRLFAKRPSASTNEVYAAAIDVQETVSKMEDLSLLQWCWDDIPDDNNSSSTPAMP
jgi:hypothetical protein